MCFESTGVVSQLLTLLPWVILFRYPLLCSESVCKKRTNKWKGEGSCLLVLVGTCKIWGWAPERSVLLIKGFREEALAFMSPWNWLIISLAEFLSADSLISFLTVLYLFRSMFFLLNFQATYCLYLSHHSFFFPLFLSQMAHCTLSQLSYDWKKNSHESEPKTHGCAVSELSFVAQAA